VGNILGTDGKILASKTIEVDGYKFDLAQLQNNPFIMLMALICIDPTEKQKELLEKAEIVFKDADDKQMFPIEKADDDK